MLQAHSSPLDPDPANQTAAPRPDPASVALVEELAPLLKAPGPVRGQALKEILGLTGSDEGLRVVAASDGVIAALVDLMDDLDPEVEG